MEHCGVFLVIMCTDCFLLCAGANWVDPPKRERKRVVNYAENEYYRQAMKVTGGARAGGPRLPKMPQLQDFQFFNVPRLMELYEKENAFEVFKHSQGQKEAALRSQVCFAALASLPQSERRTRESLPARSVCWMSVQVSRFQGLEKQPSGKKRRSAGQALSKGPHPPSYGRHVPERVCERLLQLVASVSRRLVGG